MTPAVTAAGVHDPRSLGISRYVGRLAKALRETGVEYVPSVQPRPGARAHLHLGNSSRRVAWQGPLLRERYLLTVHDVAPRTRGLLPAYRALVYPLCVRGAARVIVHSAFAADLLVHVATLDPTRIEVVPHPATPASGLSRAQARLALGFPPQGPPLAVLPGVIKGAKLGGEAVAAAAPLLARGRIDLLLAGRVADERAAQDAQEVGARLLRAPGSERYAQAIAAADCVLVLREGSVGETNGPLLDAIGAGRAVIATRSGSIPEVAGGCAVLVMPTPSAIGAALEALCEPFERVERERLATVRAAELSWRASAERHTQLLEGLIA
jgi:glycosyltransferase involved in cell wall biosynthesis